MEEGEYRNTYHDFNQQRCLFEKSVLSRRSMCEHAHRFCLADREGVACKKQQASALCKDLLSQLRSSARFALKQTSLDEPLAHAKEIKIQTGGLLGLRSVVDEPGMMDKQNEQDQPIENIFNLVQQAIEKYGGLNTLPYDEIARTMVQFKGRSRRRTDK